MLTELLLLEGVGGRLSEKEGEKGEDGNFLNLELDGFFYVRTTTYESYWMVGAAFASTECLWLSML